MKRSRSAPGLQSASSGSRRVPISSRPAVFRLVVLCEQALPDSRAAAGSDPSAARVCCDATPMAPAMGTPRRDGTDPEQPTDGAADPAVGVPTVRRDAPRSCSGTRPRPRPHRGPQRGAAQNPALVWRRGWPTVSNFSRLGAAQCRLGDKSWGFFAFFLLAASGRQWKLRVSEEVPYPPRSRSQVELPDFCSGRVPTTV